jgi:hypothetical protein
MKKAITLSCLIFGTLYLASAQIIGSIVDEKDNPIANATVVVLDNYFLGAVSDSKGKFRINIKDSFIAGLSVHHIAYQDTIIKVSDVAEDIKIVLAKSKILLDSVQVVDKRPTLEKLGNFENREESSSSGYFKVDDPRLLIGNIFKTGSCRLKEINLRFNAEEQLLATHMIEIYSLSDSVRYRDGQNYKLDLLTPLVVEPLIVQPGKTGWLKVELNDPLVVSNNEYIAVVLRGFSEDRTIQRLQIPVAQKKMKKASLFVVTEGESFSFIKPAIVPGLQISILYYPL